MRRRLTYLLLGGIALVTSLVGCAVQHVNPWERDQLAQKKMRPVPDKVEKAFDDHTYFSKEASTGGSGVGGGGCGCN